MSDAGRGELDERVLLLAPTARDAAASRDILAGVGIRSFVCPTIADLCRELGRGAGAALVTAEAVVGDTAGLLAGFLGAQPPWSDLPLVVMTPPGDDSPRLLRALVVVRIVVRPPRPPLGPPHAAVRLRLVMTAALGRPAPSPRRSKSIPNTSR